MWYQATVASQCHSPSTKAHKWFMGKEYTLLQIGFRNELQLSLDFNPLVCPLTQIHGLCHWWKLQQCLCYWDRTLLPWPGLLRVGQDSKHQTQIRDCQHTYSCHQFDENDKPNYTDYFTISIHLKYDYKRVNYYMTTLPSVGLSDSGKASITIVNDNRGQLISINDIITIVTQPYINHVYVHTSMSTMIFVKQTLLAIGELCLADEVPPLQLLYIPHLGRPIVWEGGKKRAVLEHLDPERRDGQMRGGRWEEDPYNCDNKWHAKIVLGITDAKGGKEVGGGWTGGEG